MLRATTIVSLSVLVLHPIPSRELHLHAGAVIGRASDCEIHVEDPLVSRRHARVIGSEVGTALEDLGSSNGVYVNGRRSAGVTPLHPGDVVQLGSTLWLVQLSRVP